MLIPTKIEEKNNTQHKESVEIEKQKSKNKFTKRITSSSTNHKTMYLKSVPNVKTNNIDVIKNESIISKSPIVILPNKPKN